MTDHRPGGRLRLPPLHRSLLLAAMLEGDTARTWYAEWARGVNMQTLDYASQCLLPLLHRNLQRLGHTGEHVAILRGAYRRTQYANAMLLRRAVKAVHALQAGALDPLLIRGVGMLAVHGQERVGRPTANVDLLVRRQQIHEAVDILATHGWRARLRQPLDAGVARTRDRWPLLHLDGTPLNLHWRWPHATADPDATPWDAARRVAIGGEVVHVTSAADLLLEACLQAAGWNGTARAGYVADALVIIRQDAGGLDWPRVVRHARKHGVVAPVLATLADIHRDLGGAVPENVLADLMAARITTAHWLEFHCRRSASPRLQPLVDISFDYLHQRNQPAVGARGLVRYLQLRWGLRHLRQVPLTAASLLGRALVRHVDLRHYPDDAAR